MPPSPSLSPIRPDAFGFAQARHLLQRAAFGGSYAQIRQLVEMGLDAAVESLVGYDGSPDVAEPGLDPDLIRPPTEEERREMMAARRAGDEEKLEQLRDERQRRLNQDRRQFQSLRRWWLEVMLDTPAPLREKLTLLWHSHFATKYRNVQDAYLLYQQNVMFRTHARDFAALARGIVRDPAMLRFLNNDRNVARRPNENLARELMELFTLGEGNYSEADIKNGARSLTGYHVRDNDFQFNRRAHDGGQKTILGRSGAFDGDAFVDLLLKQKACAQHVALKLYRHFVADVPDRIEGVEGPSRLVINRLATMIEAKGFDLRPVLATLFKSEHFYDPSVVGQMIKSPAQLIVGTQAVLGTPRRDAGALSETLRAMGQALFDPPSVAGWEGGRGWINTSTLFIRQNAATYLITGKDPRRNDWRHGRMNYDATALLEGLPQRTPEAVVDRCVDLLLGPHVPAARREPLVRFLREREKGVTNDSVIALLLLITAMPEYQLC